MSRRTSFPRPISADSRPRLRRGVCTRTLLALGLLAVALCCLLPPSSLAAAPLGTAFTYQGRLNEGGQPANGLYDLRFAVFDAASGPAQIGGVLTNAATPVSNGLFTVTLDFGPGVFTGDARWLAIEVRPNAVGDFVILTPRQPVTPAPYALHARSVSAPLTLIAEAAPGTAVLGVGVTGDGVAIGASNTNGEIAVLGKTDTAIWGISPRGFAGYFDGKGYFGGNVGIRTSQPQSALHVAGTVTAETFSGSGAGLTGITGAALADGSVTSPKIASGAVTADQLATNAVTASLAAAGQSAVPSGGMILSANASDSNLVSAGYVQIGQADFGELWQQGTTVAAPVGRFHHSAVWTGSEMIIWGGDYIDGGTLILNTGGRYNPAANTWTAVTTNGALSARYFHTAVWTGSEMIIWGGGGGGFLNSGARYNPAADTWAAMSTNGAPAPRDRHTAVWTGSEMIVWGGGSSLNDGGRYDPLANAWTAVSTNGAPAGRNFHSAVWTGTEMIVWGGSSSGAGKVNDGGRYDPAANAWTAVSSNGAPAARADCVTAWAGGRFVVWGGRNGSVIFGDGGVYDPALGSWTAVSSNGAPMARYWHAAVSTGSEMIVWGGYNDTLTFGDGGRFNPVANSWKGVTTTDGPGARRLHTAVWAGNQMIVWGGWTPPVFPREAFGYTPSRKFHVYLRP